MIIFSMTDSMFGMTVHITVYSLLLGISAGGLRHAELKSEYSSIGGLNGRRFSS
jgi:hypothetical protein